jgi:nicotinamide riboside kinase
MKAGKVIAILGAESTGKTTLAHTLTLELRALGHDAAVVTEYLREFCDRAGRTPRVDEQAAIAAEQTRRIQAAARLHDVVVADTSAVMIAVYSDLIFGDPSLYADALAAHRDGCDATLLTALDLPWQADGFIRDGAHVREPVDALVRKALDAAALPYGVVYGQADARAKAALSALQRLGLVTAEATGEREPDRRRWRARCAECLVAECEHLARKTTRP